MPRIQWPGLEQTEMLPTPALPTTFLSLRLRYGPGIPRELRAQRPPTSREVFWKLVRHWRLHWAVAWLAWPPLRRNVLRFRDPFPAARIVVR